MESIERFTAKNIACQTYQRDQRLNATAICIEADTLNDATA